MPYDDNETKKAIKSAYNRMYAEKHRERIAAYRRERYQKNRETILEKRRAYIKAWHKENPEAIREHKQRYRDQNREKLREAHRQYVGTDTYKESQKRKRIKLYINLEAEAGRPRPDICDICSGPPDKGSSIHYDHCHQTGRFRGWICRECNLMLGNARDNPQRLRDGAAYLERKLPNTHATTSG
jgi:hypothetical protein